GLQEDLAAQGIEKVTVRFAGARDVNGQPAGVFDVEASGKLMGRMEAELTGTFALRQSDGLEIETDLEGPLHYTQRVQGAEYVFQSTGRVHMERSSSYE